MSRTLLSSSLLLFTFGCSLSDPFPGGVGALAQVAGQGITPVQPSTSGIGEVILDCDVDSGYEVNTWEAASIGQTPLWLASVYQTHGNHGFGNHPMGAADVVFDLPGQHVLALASYEPVTWNLQIGPDTELQAIVVAGYHEQIVQGAGAVPVIEADAACGYSLPYNGEGCDTDALIAAVEAAAGLPLTRFDGCYDASSFQYVGDLTPAPEPEPEPEPETEGGVPCEAGAVVQLAYVIPAIDMAYGASDASGPGVCHGLVQFSDDLAIQQLGMADYANSGVTSVDFNGWGDNTCGAPHCNTLTYGDGRADAQMCTVVGICEDGQARATGYTW